MATTNDRTIEANGVATVTAPAEGAKVMLLSPSGALTPVTMERLAELVRGTLQVGGRNLLLGTTEAKEFPNSRSQYYTKSFNTLDHKGEEFTLSCDYELENVVRGTKNGFIGLQWPVEQRSGWQVYLNCNIYAPESGTLTQKGHLTAKMAIPTTGEIIDAHVAVAANIQSGTARIFNVKLERGNVETGYSIAPEDIADLLTENRGGVKSTFPTHYTLHPLLSEEKGGLQHERQDDYSNQRISERFADRCSSGQRIYKRCQRGNRGRGVYDGREFFQSNPECSKPSRCLDSIRSWSHESTDICEYQQFMRNVFSSQLVWNRMARLDENHVSRCNRIARRKEVVAA